MSSRPLDKSDIQKYAEEFTDFNFEIKVLNAFRHYGFATEHAGTYIDPITKKNREFDIRAKVQFGSFPYFAQLSIECKNISPSFPLIVQSVLRASDEAFHEIIDFKNNNHYPSIYRPLDPSFLYPAGNGFWVAKSFNQVGYNSKNELISSEGKTYDKMSQALNSAEALIQRCVYDSRYDQELKYIILPILVIPDDCLWEIRYDNDGRQVGDPRKISRSNYFVDLKWPHEVSGDSYTMSHLEIVTFSEIGNLANMLKSCEDSKSNIRIYEG